MEDTNSHPNSINKLNDDCLERIFWKLPIDDRVRLERVCKRFKFISERSWSNIKAMFLHDPEDEHYMPFTTESISFNSRYGRKYKLDTALVEKAFALCGRYLHQVDLRKYPDPVFSSNDVGFPKLIATHCCNLRELQMPNFFEDEEIELIFSSCKQLEKVFAGYFRQLKEIKRLPKLSKERIKVIKTNCCVKYSFTDSFTEIIRNFDNVHTLLIDHINLDLTSSLQLFAENKRIRRLEIGHCRSIYETEQISVQNINNLEHLVLISDGIYDSIINDDVVSRLVAASPKLKSLYLSNNTKLHPLMGIYMSNYVGNAVKNGMIAIGNLQHLESLTIRELPIDVNYMKTMPAIKFIFYEDKRSDMDTEKKIIPSLLLRAPNLEYLVYPQMTKQSLDLVNEFCRLRTNNLELRVFVDDDLARQVIELEYKSDRLHISSLDDYKKLQSLCSDWHQGIDYDEFKRACTMEYGK